MTPAQAARIVPQVQAAPGPTILPRAASIIPQAQVAPRPAIMPRAASIIPQTQAAPRPAILPRAASIIPQAQVAPRPTILPRVANIIPQAQVAPPPAPRAATPPVPGTFVITGRRHAPRYIPRIVAKSRVVKTAPVVAAAIASKTAAATVAAKSVPAAQQLPANGVMGTGDINQDWKLMREGKDIYGIGHVPSGRHPRFAPYLLYTGTHDKVLAQWPTVSDWAKYIADNKARDKDAFASMLPSRATVLRYGRVAAVAAAAYFTAGAATGFAKQYAQQKIEEKVKQKVAEKLMGGGQQPAPEYSAPAPVSSYPSGAPASPALSRSLPGKQAAVVAASVGIPLLIYFLV